MYCSKCGAQIDDEAFVCSNCGCATGKQLPEQKQNQLADEKSKMDMGTNFMYCSKCGAQINSEAIICPKCGCATGKQLQKQKKSQSTSGESKAGVGVLMAIFFGLIGLIIGIAIYPSGTEDRKTFLNGFWTTFGIVFSILFAVFIFFLVIYTLA